MDLGLACLMSNTYDKAFVWEGVVWMYKVTWALGYTYKKGQGIGELHSSVQNALKVKVPDFKYNEGAFMPKGTEENTLVAWQS